MAYRKAESDIVEISSEPNALTLLLCHQVVTFERLFVTCGQTVMDTLFVSASKKTCTAITTRKVQT